MEGCSISTKQLLILKKELGDDYRFFMDDKKVKVELSMEQLIDLVRNVAMDYKNHLSPIVGGHVYVPPYNWRNATWNMVENMIGGNE